VAKTWAATSPRGGGLLGQRSPLQPTGCWSGISIPWGLWRDRCRILPKIAAALTRLLQRDAGISVRASAVEFILQVFWSLWRDPHISFCVSAVEPRSQISNRGSPHRGRALRGECFVPTSGRSRPGPNRARVCHAKEAVYVVAPLPHSPWRSHGAGQVAQQFSGHRERSGRGIP
jgi:hypothetical protein